MPVIERSMQKIPSKGNSKTVNNTNRKDYIKVILPSIEKLERAYKLIEEEDFEKDYKSLSISVLPYSASLIMAEIPGAELSEKSDYKRLIVLPASVFHREISKDELEMKVFDILETFYTRAVKFRKNQGVETELNRTEFFERRFTSVKEGLSKRYTVIP